MDNITSFMAGIRPTCKITLSTDQYELYKHSNIDIYAPDGELLDTVGISAKNDLLQTSHYQLRDQVYLVGYLFGYIDRDIDLPPKATSGMADLLYRMQDFCDKHIK